MGLETFTGKVSDLVATNPPGTDPKSQGDDHLRGIKKTIIGQSVNMQIGQNSDPTHNFSASTNDDGTMKLARGNAGATTQDVMTVDSAGKVAFPQMGQLLAPKGYVKLPGGLIIQWGFVPGGTSKLPVTFQIPFPNTLYIGQATPIADLPDATAMGAAIIDSTNAGFSVQVRYSAAGASGVAAEGAWWLAIGD